MAAGAKGSGDGLFAQVTSEKLRVDLPLRLRNAFNLINAFDFAQ